MRFRVVDLENQVTLIEKFVVTCFINVPTPGMFTTFVEVCASQEGSFELVTPTIVSVESDEQLYMDEKSCRRLFRDFMHVKGGNRGEHVQTVGTKRLDVIPKKCNIQMVAPPRDEPTACCHSIGFDTKAPEGKCWGTWIFWEQPMQSRGIRNHTSHFHFEFRAGTITIENFYFFILLPPGYRMDSSRCEVSSEKDPLIELPSLNPIFEFEVTEDFPVFPVWKQYFYKRKVLRNRRSIRLNAGQQVSCFFNCVSEILSHRLAMRSFFIGIGMAWAVSILSEAVASMFLKDFPLFFLIGSLLLTIGLGYVGWKLIQW